MIDGRGAGEFAGSSRAHARLSQARSGAAPRLAARVVRGAHVCDADWHVAARAAAPVRPAVPDGAYGRARARAHCPPRLAYRRGAGEGHAQPRDRPLPRTQGSDKPELSSPSPSMRGWWWMPESRRLACAVLVDALRQFDTPMAPELAQMQAAAHRSQLSAQPPALSTPPCVPRSGGRTHHRCSKASAPAQARACARRRRRPAAGGAAAVPVGLRLCGDVARDALLWRVQPQPGQPRDRMREAVPARRRLPARRRRQRGHGGRHRFRPSRPARARRPSPPHAAPHRRPCTAAARRARRTRGRRRPCPNGCGFRHVARHPCGQVPSEARATRRPVRAPPALPAAARTRTPRARAAIPAVCRPARRRRRPPPRRRPLANGAAAAAAAAAAGTAGAAAAGTPAPPPRHVRGDDVWYRDSDGRWQPPRINSVHYDDGRRTIPLLPLTAAAPLER